MDVLIELNPHADQNNDNNDLLVVFGHFSFSVVALFIYHIDLLVQFFAQSLQTGRSLFLSRVFGGPLAECAVDFS